MAITFIIISPFPENAVMMTYCHGVFLNVIAGTSILALICKLYMCPMMLGAVFSRKFLIFLLFILFTPLSNFFIQIINNNTILTHFGKNVYTPIKKFIKFAQSAVKSGTADSEVSIVRKIGFACRITVEPFSV